MIRQTQQLLSSLGVSHDMKRTMDLEGWNCYSLNHNSQSRNTPILLIESGPRNIADLRRVAKKWDTCVMLASNLGKLYIKTLEKTHTVSLYSSVEAEMIVKIFLAKNVAAAKNSFELNAYLENSVDAIPSTTDYFENRGLFSTHYLQNRIFDDPPPPVPTYQIAKCRYRCKVIAGGTRVEY